MHRRRNGRRAMPAPRLFQPDVGLADHLAPLELLGRDVGVLVWLGPVVAVTLLLIGYRLWLFGLRHYASTGS